MAYLQTHLAVRGPVVDRQGPDFEAEEDVSFRVGRFGRLEWTKGDADGWTQWMPPSLQGMAAPPELMIAQMDAVGVDKAVLYQGSLVEGLLRRKINRLSGNLKRFGRKHNKLDRK